MRAKGFYFPIKENLGGKSRVKSDVGYLRGKEELPQPLSPVLRGSGVFSFRLSFPVPTKPPLPGRESWWILKSSNQYFPPVLNLLPNSWNPKERMNLKWL